MSKERKFSGVWIPKEIWLNPDLSPIEKLFLAEIDSLDNDEKKGCFASNEYFGNFFKISEGRAANIISGLRKRGYTVQVYFDGTTRGMRLHENVKSKEWLSLHENVKAGFTKRGKQVSRKREHTNIVDNKVNNKEEEKKCASSSFLNAEKETVEGKLPGAPSPFPVTVVEVHEQGLPVVTVYDQIPTKQYPTQEPHGEWKRVNIPDELETLKTDAAIREAFSMGRKIPSANFPEYLEAFRLDVIGRGETYANVKQLRAHFLNWSGSRFEIAQRKAAQPKPQISNGQPAKMRQL